MPPERSAGGRVGPRTPHVAPPRRATEHAVPRTHPSASQAVDSAPDPGRRPWVVALVTAVMALLAITAPTSVGAQAAPTVEPGEVVVTRQAEGTVEAVAADGSVRTLVTGLSQPRAVQVLQDGSLVIAESGADRIVGIGGRFGPDLAPIADYPFPNGLYQALDGSFSEGKVSRLELGTAVITDLATGLQTPGGLVVRNGTAYVAELNAQRVVSIDQAGRVVPIAEGFSSPLGVAVGRGAVLYVSDFGTGEIIRIENGERSVLASLPEPRNLASDPVVPRADEPFRLVASTEAGVVEVDPDTGEIGATVAAPGAVGVAVVRQDPTVATSSTATTAEVGTPGLPQAEPSTSSSSSDGEPTGSPSAVIVLAVVILITIGGFLAVQLRRANAADEDDVVERDDESLHDAFGPCVTQELEAERAQAALDAVILQVEALRRRVEQGTADAEAAANRLAEARAGRERLLAERTAAVAAGDADDDEPHPIHQAELHLTSPEGRAALAEYRLGGIGPVELARRWEQAGETEAITQVREAGERARQVDPTVPGPDERAATAELADAEADVDQARHDLSRLADRERTCREQLAAAAAALEACRAEHAGAEGDDPDQAAAWKVAGGRREPAGVGAAVGSLEVEGAHADLPAPPDPDRPAPPDAGGSRPAPPAGGGSRPAPPAGGGSRPAPPAGGGSRPAPPDAGAARPAPPDGTLPTWSPPAT